MESLHRLDQRELLDEANVTIEVVGAGPRPMDAPSEHVCTKFRYAGSNSCFKRKTCMDCGTVTKERIVEQATRVSEECTHERLSYARSDRKVRSTHCLDCLETLYEETQ